MRYKQLTVELTQKAHIRKKGEASLHKCLKSQPFMYLFCVQSIMYYKCRFIHSWVTFYQTDVLLYKLLFSRGFYFREFREPDPRENFNFNSCLFIVMTTSEKSRN